MKQKLKKITLLSILSVISLVFLRCQSEENAVDNSQDRIKTVTTNEAKDFLNFSKNNSFAKSTNNGLENIEFDKIAQEKINGSDQLLTVIPFAANNAFENDRILLLKIDNEIKSVIFKMYPDENSVKGSFSGKLLVYSIDGNFINGFRAKDGFIVSQFFDNDNTVKNNSTGKSAVQLKEVVVQNNYRKTVHALDMFGAQGMFVDFGGGDSYYSWDVGDGGSGITTLTTAQIASELEKQIDGTKLDPCTKAVLEKLKNLTQNDIAIMITRFDTPKSIFNIKISTGTTTKTENSAETTKISDYNYNIVINSNYTNGVLEGEINSPPTTISLATTITHEIIHAYLLSVVDEYTNGSPSALMSFPTLFDAYVQSKTSIGSNQSKIDAQHDLIASQYVNAIASTIEEFDTGIPVTSGFPKQVYIDIAWAGLEGTYIFNKNYPNDQNNKNYTDRNRILSRGSIEKYNKPRGNQVPIGKPCK